MANILVLKSSILGQYSQSNNLIDGFIADHRGDNVKVRDLAASNLPVLDGELAAGLRGGDQLNDRQKTAVALSDELIAEVKTSDTVIIGAPMYNFNIPTQLKNWIDLITRAGVTFRYSEQGPVGLLEKTKVVVVSSQGGMHVGTQTDAITPYLTALFSLLGLSDVQFIYAEGLNMGPQMQESALNKARSELKALVV